MILLKSTAMVLIGLALLALATMIIITFNDQHPSWKEKIIAAFWFTIIIFGSWTIGFFIFKLFGWV